MMRTIQVMGGGSHFVPNQKRTLAYSRHLASGQDRRRLRRVLRARRSSSRDEGLSVAQPASTVMWSAGLGTLRKLLSRRLFSRKGGRQPRREFALCIAMIVARLIDPASKLATRARFFDARRRSVPRPRARARGVDRALALWRLDWR